MTTCGVVRCIALALYFVCKVSDGDLVCPFCDVLAIPSLNLEAEVVNCHTPKGILAFFGVVLHHHGQGNLVIRHDGKALHELLEEWKSWDKSGSSGDSQTELMFEFPDFPLLSMREVRTLSASVPGPHQTPAISPCHVS